MSAPPLPPAARAFSPGTFANRVAVVTGGGTGLGLEMSRGLAALGARVVVASRNENHHVAIRDEAAREGWRVETVVLDVREAAAVERAAADVEARIGPVDVLVNNAAGNFVCPSERLSARGWRAVVGISLDGTFFCTRYFGKGMLARRRGDVLNVVATYAWTGMPGVVHSAAAKAGVLAMTRTLAAEWAPLGVRVNAIAPGPFESAGAAANLWPDPESRERVRESIPLGRFGGAAEVAAQALWLLSPSSAWVTGECLVVDGGMSLGRGRFLSGGAAAGPPAPAAEPAFATEPGPARGPAAEPAPSGVSRPSEFERLEALVRAAAARHGFRVEVTGWTRKTFDVYLEHPRERSSEPMAQIESYATVDGAVKVLDARAVAFADDLRVAIRAAF